MRSGWAKIFSAAAFCLIMQACGAGTENASDNNRTEGPPAPDSMPILHPGQFDSSGTIRTPPVNDDMNAWPDSTKKPE